MAILTTLDDADLAAVAAAYGLGSVRGEGVLAGSVNTNYRLETRDGEHLFLRVYEEQGREGAERDVRLLARLARDGVPTPAPRACVTGGDVFELRGKACAVMPWIDGTQRCQRTVTTDDMTRVGAALAGVHTIGETFSESDALTTESRFDRAALARRLGRVAETSDEIAAAVRRIRDVLEDLDRRTSSAPELPLIHGDLFRDNVIFSEHRAFLLDFESASRGQAAFDVAVTVLAWCFGDELDPILCRAFASGYAAGRNLTSEEAAELFDAARFACARFTTTRLTDYEQRPRGLGVYKDFRRWLRRLDAVESLGSERFAATLGFA